MKTDKASAQRSTVVGVFHSHEEAVQAVTDLKSAGFKDDQISLVGKNKDGEMKAEGSKAASGALTGAAVGGGAAALMSLGISFGVIPVIGPILAVGPLAAALISAVGGAAAASLVGGLIGLGIPEHEAKYYEGEVQSGRFLVTVHAASRYDEAWRILHGRGAYNHQVPAATAAVARQGTASRTSTGAAGERTMQLHEEQLHATKQQVQTGEVRVHKEVVTEHKTLDVPVTREEIVIERRPAHGQTASASDIRPGEEMRIPVREEQVRVQKEVVVTEEVNVGKRKVQDTEHVGGTVRKEEVRVEQQGDVDVRTKGAKQDKGR